MFAYCLNNPVTRYDPSGKYSCFLYRSEYDNPFSVHYMCMALGSGGGGGGGSSFSSTQYKTSGALSDNQEDCWGGTSHGKILPWEFDFFSISDDGFTIVDAGVSLMEASVEWENLSVMLLECFSADISAGITKEDGLHCEAMASIVSSGASLSFGPVNVEVVGHLGAVGGKASVNTNGFSAGLSYWGVGGEIAFSWDYELGG